MKRILATLLLCCAAAWISAPAAAAEPEEAPAFDGYILRADDVLLTADESPEGCQVLADGLFYAETAADALALAELGSVIYCEPNYELTIQDEFQDYEPVKWNLHSVGAQAAWEHRDTAGRRDRLGDGVTVAIVDSGVMADHPDLLGARILDCVNFSTEEDGLDNYHGTFIAGLLAAGVNNGIGVDGMVPHATILPVCVTWNGGRTDVKTAVQGIRAAVDLGADVITFSIGGTNDNAALREACDYASDRGVILVTSAGNYTAGRVKSETTYMYPAAYDCVVSVSACRQTEDGVVFDDDYSYFNDAVTVAAPGTGIESLYLDGGTATRSGTSYAAPVVTAMAIMARQADPSLGVQGFKALLQESSVDLGESGYDVYYGYGYVNVPAFLDALDGTELPAAQVASASLTLAGDVGVNYYLVPNAALLADSGAYARFTFRGQESEPILLRETPENVKNGVRRLVLTHHAAAKEMTERITLRVYTSTGCLVPLTGASGNPLADGASCSVARYCAAVTSPAGRSMMEKLGSFGAMAMAYFDYTPVEPDTDYLSAIVPLEETVTAEDLAAFRAAKSGSAHGLAVRSVSLTLDAATTLNLSFALENGCVAGDYDFAVDGVPAQPVPDGAGRCLLRIPGIPARALSRTHTVTATRDGETLTLTCSPLSYVRSVLLNHGSDPDKEALCSLARALYAYGAAAEAYFQ